MTVAVPGRRAVELLRAVLEAADDAGQPEDEQQVADDAAGDRGLDDRGVMRAQRGDGDDQFGGVAERGVEEAAERRSGALGEVVGGARRSGRRRESSETRRDARTPTSARRPATSSHQLTGAAISRTFSQLEVNA